MVATNVLEFRSKSIQQELYQAVYDIKKFGPNNFRLASNFLLPNDDKVNVIKLGVIGSVGEQTSLEVFLTEMRDVGSLGRREEWEFEGILWSRQVHAKMEGSSTIKAKVRGTYHSFRHEGKLYVLAHDQPKPIVEVLRWDEICERVKTYDLAVFKMCGRDGAWDAKIDYLVEASHKNGKLSMKCAVDLYHFLTAGAVSPPLALADGRVLFSADGLDCTIYKPGTYGKK